MANSGAGALAIVVVNFASSELLSLNLAPLSRSLPEATVVVVDNLTSSAERERVRALAAHEGWLTETPDSNTGFGVGVNIGVARALAGGCEFVLILNPDASIDSSSVATLVERCRAVPLALLAPRIERPDGSAWFEGSDIHLVDGRLRNPRHRPTHDWEPWLTGACLLASAQLWELVGGFDPDYFLYWEDVDLSHRVLAAGGSLELCERAVAVHAEGGTQGEGHDTAGLRKSDTYYYFAIRNRLYFAAKHLDDAGVRRWLSNSRAVALETLLQGGRRQFLRSLRPLIVARRALRDGRRFVRESRSI